MYGYNYVFYYKCDSNFAFFSFNSKYDNYGSLFNFVGIFWKGFPRLPNNRGLDFDHISTTVYSNLPRHLPFNCILRLSEVLDEDNIVQEVVHRNKKLISYLCRADTLKEMVELVSLDSAYKVWRVIEDYKTYNWSC